MKRSLDSPMKNTIVSARAASLPPVNDPHTDICSVNFANVPGESKKRSLRSPLARTFDIKGKKLR